MARTCFVSGQLDFGALVLDPEIIAKTAVQAAAKARAAARKAVTAPKTKPRRCLHCSRNFASTGAGQRICSPCKNLKVFTCSPSSFSVHASF